MTTLNVSLYMRLGACHQKCANIIHNMHPGWSAATNHMAGRQALQARNNSFTTQNTKTYNKKQKSTNPPLIHNNGDWGVVQAPGGNKVGIGGMTGKF